MLNKEIVNFAAKTDFYEASMSYFCDKKQSAENKGLMQEAYLAEVEAKAGVKAEGLDVVAWANHPSVRWAAMQVLDAAVTAILPEVMLPQFRDFCDMRTVGYGDTVHFTVKPNTMYTVSKSAMGQRETVRQRKGDRDVFVTPIVHAVTVYENMLNVLSGKANIADFMGWIIASFETAMYADGIAALTTALSADPHFYTTGAFDLATLVEMCEKVQAKNGGAKPIICGSASALLNVLPDSAKGYRMNIEGGRGIELIPSVIGYDVIKLDNAVNAAGSLVLPSNKIFIVSPAADKILKGVLNAGLANGNDYFETADITKNFTYRRGWDFVAATSAFGGVYTITQ